MIEYKDNNVMVDAHNYGWDVIDCVDLLEEYYVSEIGYYERTVVTKATKDKFYLTVYNREWVTTLSCDEQGNVTVEAHDNN